MPLALQVKLLRVVQQREVTPLGSDKTIKLNVRIIAATNQNLKKAIEEGAFREDLYFRLNVVDIGLPALRERRQDLPFLTQHLIQKFNQELGKEIKGVSADLQQCLLRYQYPGNVRELSNIIESAMVFSEGPYLQLDDVSEEIKAAQTNLQSQLNGDIGTAVANLVGLPLKSIEELVIVATLQKNKGHRKKTAQMLSISERGLRDKINQYKER